MKLHENGSIMTCFWKLAGQMNRCRPKANENLTTIKSDSGFTLIEVLVSLVLGTLIVGGVMGVVSVSLQYTQRVDKKSVVQPVLEAAAQELLVHPEKAQDGSLTLSEFPNKPTVDVSIASVQGADGYEISNRVGQLYRVQISYERNLLEFSLIIPQSELQ